MASIHLKYSIGNILLGITYACLAVAGWIVFNDTSSFYILFLGPAIPAILFISVGILLILNRNGQMTALIVPIIAISGTAFLAGLINLFKVSYVFGASHVVSVNPKSILFAIIVAVSFIGLSLSLLLIFFYHKLLIINIQDVTDDNNQNSSDTSSPNITPNWFNIYAVSLVAILSGCFTVILGVGGMIFFKRHYTLANYYSGALVIVMGALGRLVYTIPNVSYIKFWQLIYGRLNIFLCLCSISMICYSFYSTSQYTRTAINFVMFLGSLLLALVNLSCASLISFGRGKETGTLFFPLQLSRYLTLNSLVRIHKVTGVTQAIYGCLGIAAGFISMPLLSALTSTFLTFVTGCILLSTGQIGLNAMYQQQEETISCHMVMSVVACCCCLCNLPLAIWDYVEYISKNAVLHYSTALAMLIVYFAILVPGFFISLYAAIRISRTANETSHEEELTEVTS
ncbi:uncharacterized protein TRIADDRAFT_57361 [Trichoplax adhaerens]|uniref:Uncharacterized protein n=1 Tax=Trichoplax adhaerens TaxID=10228 RepID=B3RZ83_TRIAD|nr:predicted protein [Trichoplax adhaerens]EDV24157.1 predicted protein [Trichoplax adhaerens]|eukprot:XP_002113683.1 predicted protein [Trichoplax adhaerens]